MRGADRQTASMFSYISPEGLVPQNHPLRAICPTAARCRINGESGFKVLPRRWVIECTVG